MCESKRAKTATLNFWWRAKYSLGIYCVTLCLFLFVDFVLECFIVTESLKGLQKALDIYLANGDICSDSRLEHLNAVPNSSRSDTVLTDEEVFRVLARTELSALRSRCDSKVLIMGTGLWTRFSAFWSLSC